MRRSIWQQWFAMAYVSDREPCMCGHGWLHHRGFREPGCSYLGTCKCSAYRPA